MNILIFITGFFSLKIVHVKYKVINNFRQEGVERQRRWYYNGSQKLSWTVIFRQEGPFVLNVVRVGRAVLVVYGDNHVCSSALSGLVNSGI